MQRHHVVLACGSGDPEGSHNRVEGWTSSVQFVRIWN
jgi:hypothetical protein